MREKNDKLDLIIMEMFVPWEMLLRRWKYLLSKEWEENIFTYLIRNHCLQIVFESAENTMAFVEAFQKW